MEKHYYMTIWEQEDDGGYHAFCPAIKGCHSQGDIIEEALANIKEAIEVYIASMRDRGETLPVEDILIKPIEVAL